MQFPLMISSFIFKYNNEFNETCYISLAPSSEGRILNSYYVTSEVWNLKIGHLPSKEIYSGQILTYFKSNVDSCRKFS